MLSLSQLEASVVVVVVLQRQRQRSFSASRVCRHPFPAQRAVLGLSHNGALVEEQCSEHARPQQHSEPSATSGLTSAEGGKKQRAHRQRGRRCRRQTPLGRPLREAVRGANRRLPLRIVTAYPLQSTGTCARGAVLRVSHAAPTQACRSMSRRWSIGAVMTTAAVVLTRTPAHQVAVTTAVTGRAEVSEAETSTATAPNRGAGRDEARQQRQAAAPPRCAPLARCPALQHAQSAMHTLSVATTPLAPLCS
jgi:hypothetical protein